MLGDNHFRIGFGRSNTNEIVQQWYNTLLDVNHPATSILYGHGSTLSDGVIEGYNQQDDQQDNHQDNQPDINKPNNMATEENNKSGQQSITEIVQKQRQTTQQTTQQKREYHTSVINRNNNFVPWEELDVKSGTVPKKKVLNYQQQKLQDLQDQQERKDKKLQKKKLEKKLNQPNTLKELLKDVENSSKKDASLTDLHLTGRYKSAPKNRLKASAPLAERDRVREISISNQKHR